MSIYFLLYRVSRFSTLLSPNMGFHHTSIYPYIHPWHWSKYHSFSNCLASHDLLVIKLGYIPMAGLATWKKLFFRGFGGSLAALHGLFEMFWCMFLISTFSLRLLTRDHSGWLVVQVGFFPHMMCLESIIPYQLFVFTQLNPYVGLAHLEWFLFGASVIQYSYPSILLGSWMVFLVVILADPMFRLRSYSPYPRGKGLLIFVVNCDLLANPIISLSYCGRVVFHSLACISFFLPTYHGKMNFIYSVQ